MLLIAMLLIVVACSEQENGAGNTDVTSESNSPKPTETPEPEPSKENKDPLGKYDPPIEISAIRAVDSTIKYLEGDSIESNVWIKAYEEELGIKLKYEWTADISQYAQKVNVAAASGSLPEFLHVDGAVFQRLLESNMLVDLSEVYEKYAAPLTKEVMTQDGGKAMEMATRNGKLYALPQPEPSFNQANMLWVRTDWLEKLNLPEPKTMEDVLAISKAFTTEDPDGNNQDDTFGLGLMKDLYRGPFASLMGFFNGFHAYPSAWIETPSGELAYGSIQPEMKEALKSLRDMFERGEIDPEFGIKPWAKESELAVSGKLGMVYGVFWNAINPLQNNINQDPEAEWKVFPIVSVDEQPAKPLSGNAVNNYYVVIKGANHPEAMVKMLNLHLERSFGETQNRDKYVMLPQPDGTHLHVLKYSFFNIAPIMKNIEGHVLVTEALKSNDTSSLNDENMATYTNIKKYLEGNREFWNADRTFGSESAFQVIKQYVDNESLQYNGYGGPLTPTMVSKGSVLNEIEITTFTKIIMGELSLEEFDNFVEEWKEIGGDELTMEVNEWYQSK